MRTSFLSVVAAVSIAVLAAGHAGRAAAGIYKCMVEGNAPVYQEGPCPPGKELRNFDTDPPEVSVIPFRVVPDLPPSAVAPKAAGAPTATKADKKAAAPAGIDPTQRKFIVPGMGEGEVMAKIGAPDMTTGGKGSKSARWSYLPVPADPKTITTVVFDFGKVILVERKVVN
jgi:hypothetical protein